MPWGQDLDEVQLDIPFSAELDAYDQEYRDWESDSNLDTADGESDGDDGAADMNHSHAPSTAKERRRAQDAIFDAFAAEQQVVDTTEEVRKTERIVDEARLSVRDLLERQESSTRIASPRDYQTELFLKAKEENIVAVLDTGSGKTHIATMLLQNILDDELESRAKGVRRRIAFFLVDSVSLVFQQSNVLRHGLDQNVEGICGAMGASLWRKTTWNKLFDDNMVIVCTAQVLVECMMHSFIQMSEINILIFDEAHHAKSNHPYARIMKEFYLQEPDTTKRPRIFGMTASPVDANIDVKEATKELEALLHCKIATASDLTLLQNNISRPDECVDKYLPLLTGAESQFYQEMESRYGTLPIFEKLFKASKLFGRELGRWASDIYWSFALSEEQAHKMGHRQERLLTNVDDASIPKLETEITQLKEAADFVSKHDFGSISPTLRDLSSKVLSLHHNWLQKYYERTGEARTIVFVERRYTARLLSLIFFHLGGDDLRCGYLVGNSFAMGDQKASLKTQFVTLDKFRRGDINCLFATSVAEEGLDIPQCNLVVRFDLYRTMIGYVQSRGRARHRNSKYVHMVELGNDEDKTLVLRARSAEQVMRNFCSGLPTDRIINEIDDDVERFLADDSAFPTYVNPSSGARLTFRSSLSILAHFVASLPNSNQEMTLQPSYIVERRGDSFYCEVILPEYSPIHSMCGKPQRRKAFARCSAAFELCLELHRRGLIDDELLPTYVKQVSAMRNARLAVNEKRKNLYKMRVKPNFWDFGYGTMPEQIYLTVIDVSAGLDRPHQPIGLLTRQPLPTMPEFPIYRNEGQATQIRSVPLNMPLGVDEKTLRQFNTVTLQIYRHIFAKKFEDEPTKMSYWILPLIPDMTTSMSQTMHPKTLIDWDQVDKINANERHPWTPPMSPEFFENKYLVDPHDGGRRFYAVDMRPDVSPMDPVPDYAPRHKWENNILGYTVSLWKKGRDAYIAQLDEDGPVVEAEKIPFRRNLLAPVEHDEDEIKGKAIALLCPQATLISTLSPRFVAMCYVFPAIIHRFESYLLALDACELFKLNISPALALEALTKDSDTSEEENDDIVINFKSGMGPNYERLEFMGDCFLKMATTIATFTKYSKKEESDLHDLRMVMLCNSNLYKTAKNYKLYEYVRTMAFSRRTWYPEGIKLTWGKGSNRTRPQEIKHSLGDKSVADVCEALIGAAFIEHNDPERWSASSWDQAVKAVKLFVDSEDHIMESFSQYYQAYEKPIWQLADSTASQIDMAEKIERIHPYHFKHPRLLRSVFIHPSRGFAWEKIPNYQRLEFLGDSLLDQVFIMDIFYRFPDKGPHWLTEHKMPMVSNKFLGAVCTEMGLHKYMRHNHAEITIQISDYIQELQQAKEEATGKDDYWGFWMHVSSEPPKCLADIVEAYVGALFIDSDFNFSVVQQFYDMHLKKYFANMTLYDDFAGVHPFNRLVKMFQVDFGCNEFRVTTRDQPESSGSRRVISMVQIHYKVYFHDYGDGARYSKPRVCHKALEKLEGLPPYEFRRLYGCDCQGDVEDVGEKVDSLANGLGQVALDEEAQA